MATGNSPGAANATGLRGNAPRITAAAPSSDNSDLAAGAIQTLPVWLARNAPEGHGPELAAALGAVATACKAIAGRIARAGLEGLYGAADAGGANASGDAQKKLDVVAVRCMMDGWCSGGGDGSIGVGVGCACFAANLVLPPSASP